MRAQPRAGRPNFAASSALSTACRIWKSGPSKPASLFPYMTAPGTRLVGSDSGQSQRQQKAGWSCNPCPTPVRCRTTWDSEAPEFVLVANARLHEDLWRVYRAKRQNHFAPRANATSTSFIRNLDAGDSVALEG